MLFNFVDKITYFQNKKSAVGIKTITTAQTPYMHNNKIYPMMLLEAIGQLNAWITMEMNDFQVRPVAILYGEINIYDTAKLGDEIIVETELTRFDESTSIFNGRIKRGKEVLIEVFDAAGSFLDINQFAYPEEYKKQFKALNKKQLLNQLPSQTENIESIEDITKRKSLFQYDKIIQLDNTKYIAKKTINNQHDFFKEHFPKKPVLPISILLQNNIELGKAVLAKTGVKIDFPKKISLKKIKMRDFIPPNSEIQTIIELLKNTTKEELRIKFSTQIEDKNICRGFITFSS